MEYNNYFMLPLESLLNVRFWI